MMTAPFQTLSVDFQGPYFESDSKRKHILARTDHFTKSLRDSKCRWPWPASPHGSKVLSDRIFSRYGVSSILISDRGECFINDPVVKINHVDHKLIMLYRSQTNGPVEAYHQFIGKITSHVVTDNSKDWDKFVTFYQLAHNSSRHTIINASLSVLSLFREMKLPYDLTKPELPPA